MKLAVAALLAGSAAAFAPAQTSVGRSTELNMSLKEDLGKAAAAFAPAQTSVARSTELNMSLKEDLGKAAVAVGLAVAAGPAQAITKSGLNQLSYLQVKGTGL